MTRQWLKEKYGHEALEEIDRYMEGRGCNVILVYAGDYTFEVLGGVVTDHAFDIDIDSMIEQIGIDMDEYAAWRGCDDWDYESLMMIRTDQWNIDRIVDETVEYLKMTAEIRALNGHTDFLKQSAHIYAGLEIKANYPWLRYREFKEIVDRCVEECGGGHVGRTNEII